MAGMTGYTPAEYVFKKTNQAITLAVKTSVKIDNEVVQIDPQLLFQRLIIAAKETEKLQAAFKYELCSFPASLCKGCETFHADEDADLLIVLTAVKSEETMNTVLVGDDTDLLVLLCYHGNLASHELFFKLEPKKDEKKVRVWNIKALRDILRPQTSKHFLFLHAVLGCDTTSHLYGVGKSVSLKKFLKNDDFKKVADVFHNENSSQDEIAEAGEHTLISFYNGSRDEKLDNLRYTRFCEKVSTSKNHIKPQTLPPTCKIPQSASILLISTVEEFDA